MHGDQNSHGNERHRKATHDYHSLPLKPLVQLVVPSIQPLEGASFDIAVGQIHELDHDEAWTHIGHHDTKNGNQSIVEQWLGFGKHQEHDQSENIGERCEEHGPAYFCINLVSKFWIRMACGRMEVLVVQDVHDVREGEDGDHARHSDHVHGEGQADNLHKEKRGSNIENYHECDQAEAFKGFGKCIKGNEDQKEAGDTQEEGVLF